MDISETTKPTERQFLLRVDENELRLLRFGLVSTESWAAGYLPGEQWRQRQAALRASMNSLCKRLGVAEL
jgi:hypothetical protein